MKNTKIRNGAIMKQPTQNGDRFAVPDNSVSTSKIQDNATTYNKLSVEVQSLLFQNNLIDNAEGLLFQRSTPATPTLTNDDSFGPDRWNILCSANGVNVSRSTDAPDGCFHAIKLDKATGSGQFGMAQMKENRDSQPLRNKTINWSGSVKTESSEVTEVRISILGWTGTADSITSDVVSSWASTPTYIANVVEYATTTLLLTNSYQEFSLNATIGGTCNNIIFFIHTTNSESVGDSIFVSAMRSYKGAVSVPYIRRIDEEEFRRCFRYFCKSYDLDTAPGASPTDPFNTTRFSLPSSQAVRSPNAFKVAMRVGPSVTTYSASGGASGQVDINNVGQAVGAVSSQQNGFWAETTSAATGSITYGYQWTASAEL